MRRTTVAGTALAVLLSATAVAPGWAAAPRGSVQQAGTVLKWLDLSQPPSYPNEFFTPPPEPGAPGGRETLSDDVSDALQIMAGQTTAVDYCPPINDILTLATGTNRYFDISQTSNPALESFRKDWLKVKSLAGC